MPIDSGSVDSLPDAYQAVLHQARQTHQLDIQPLQRLGGGRSGAYLYLVSVTTRGADHPAHYILKLDQQRYVDEGEKHRSAVKQSPLDFARRHLPDLPFEPLEVKGQVAIFYTVAGDSLIGYRPLVHFDVQQKHETIFQQVATALLADWNANAQFEQAIHPRNLLVRWLTRRLDPGSGIERFLFETCGVDPDIPGLMVNGHVYPNPLRYARREDEWGGARAIDALVGLQHGDLNVTNILVRFDADGEALANYYLIDFATFKAPAPLLYDHAYLEMSYLTAYVPRVAFSTWAALMAHISETPITDPRRVPSELAGASSVIQAGRQAFADWVQVHHATLQDDLWGQYWLAGVAAGLNFCNKTNLPDLERLAGLVFAAAHLQAYCGHFGIAPPKGAIDITAWTAGATPTLARLGTFAARHNIPIPLTSFIGREALVESVSQQLGHDDVRLLTLSGPGGVGKTRLSLEVARTLLEEFPDGVYFVDVAAATTPDHVLSAIAKTLDVREIGGRSQIENLYAFLGDRTILLLLDNFEQAVEAAAFTVADLLAHVPGLKILITSRTVLNLQGEHEISVQPLTCPTEDDEISPEQLMQTEAVQLFVSRAQAVRADFDLSPGNLPAVSEICARLDGLPLAVELAAARVKLMPPEMIRDRLDDALGLLRGGARDLPARQQTLRRTLDWSYELLKAPEQVLLARLGVFSGNFSLEAVEAICNPAGDLAVMESVEMLIDNSLLQQREGKDGRLRFRMLETIRVYAQNRLRERDEKDQIRRLHAVYLAERGTELANQLYSSASAPWILDWFDEEHDDFRAALTWCEETADESARDLAAGLTLALYWYWYRRGHTGEGRKWTERILEWVARPNPTSAHAQVLTISAMMTIWQGDFVAARPRIEESLRMMRWLEDGYGIGNALLGAGVLELNQGHETAARPLFEEARALWQELGFDYGVPLTHMHLGNVEMGMGNFDAARHWLEDGLKAAYQIGDGWIIAALKNNNGDVARAQGDYEAAQIYYQESGDLWASLGDQGDLARSYFSQGCVALRLGEPERAESLFERSLEMFQRLGNVRGFAECLAGYAGLAAQRGQPERAAVLLGTANSVMTEFGAAWWPADVVENDRNLAQIREALDEAEFDSAWKAGKAMSLDEALVFAAKS